MGKEAINHPPHYNTSKFETIDVIEAWGLGFNLGNSVKYISRAEHKSNPIEDLRKAQWYLEREIRNRVLALIRETAEAAVATAYSSAGCAVAVDIEYRKSEYKYVICASVSFPGGGTNTASFHFTSDILIGTDVHNEIANMLVHKMKGTATTTSAN
jgi:hypothetical protein